MERICLVEDDPDIVQMLRAFLQQEGFSVCHAVGQQGALALLAQGCCGSSAGGYFSGGWQWLCRLFWQRRTKICRWSS